MTNEKVVAILGELKKCYLGEIVDALDFAIETVKAQEPETSDVSKPDSDIGCWYDITHNYTLEQVVSALKSRELCEDAVSRKYLLDQSYSIKFQTIDESDEEAYREEVVCIEDIEDAPSVQPISVARVMTLEEVKEKIGSGEYVFTECEKEGQWMRYGDARLSVDQGDSCRIAFLISRRGDDPYVRWWWIFYKNYNKTWRCWTFRPTEEKMEATLWNRRTSDG